jgi:NTE family protein
MADNAPHPGTGKEMGEGPGGTAAAAEPVPLHPDPIRQALFSDFGPDVRTALIAASTPRPIAAGEVLVHQGDDADALFFVRSGRFRVLVVPEDMPGTAPHQIAEIEAGEPIGELAFFGGGTRSATIQASRDSLVLELDRAGYERVAAAYPHIVSALLKAVSRRLAGVTARAAPVSPRPPRIIAMLPLGRPLDPGRMQQLRDSIDRLVPARASTVIIGRQDVAGADGLAERLAREEKAGRYVLLDCHDDGKGADWAGLACRNADALVTIAEADDAPLPPTAQERAAWNWIWPANRHMVLVHRQWGFKPEGTAAWLAGRDIHQHHHIWQDRPQDVARLARFLTGRAVGLVLSGGGAMGCAHLGVARALAEANIPIDHIGGTSAGAAMGAALAYGFDPQEIVQQMEEMFVEAACMRRLTIPVHSLLDARVFDEQLRLRYGTRDITDMPIPFFAVATNLSTNAMEVMDSGPTWHAVRASGALPGILPPFVDGKGNVLVDGCVLDNIPVRTMHAAKTGPNIVVTLSDLSSDWHVTAAYEGLRGRGRLLADIVLRRKAPDDFPGIFQVLQKSLVVSSRMAAKSSMADDDILIAPPVLPGMELLDWHRGRELADLAYAHMTARIANEPEVFARLGT